jgi:hypothetical protein
LRGSTRASPEEKVRTVPEVNATQRQRKAALTFDLKLELELSSSTTPKIQAIHQRRPYFHNQIDRE